MAIFINETGRSFPNIDEGGIYKKVWRRPDDSDYEDYSYHSSPGPNYRITFNDSGPGTSVFGSDKVYYIGDNDERCFGQEGVELNECDYNRQPIFRWYRSGGDNIDHKYTPVSQLRWPFDFTGEQTDPDSTKVNRHYNREPRNGAAVFFILRSAKSGKTVPLVHYYENSRNDTQLTTGSNPGGGYVEIETLGYIWTSRQNALEGADTDEEPVPLYEYYRPSSSSLRDHFYTVDPASEVNLQTGVSGVPDCKDPRDEEYRYQGILGWVYASDSGRGTRKIYADVGLIGPIGYCAPYNYTGERRGWFAWEVNDLAGHPTENPDEPPSMWTQENYEYQFDADAGALRTYDAYGQLLTPARTFRENRLIGSYSVHRHPSAGWGNPNIIECTNFDAYFEWIYGKNGAVKAAVPKYLEFHTAFDSQFVYYIYNTTYPWKGPIFSVQYCISDRNQCPNDTVNVTTTYDDYGDEDEEECICNEALITKEYFSHFYEIREDSWRTTQTQLQLTDFSDQNVKESFKSVDTESTTILFRYISSGVDRFAAGDTINGWEIGELGYFGNSLKCGYMELQGNGNKFTEGQNFTADGRFGARIEVLAGYGVADRAGFFGVFEFPKQISYYKVEIDNTALIHQKTLDQAELRANVDESGKIRGIEIVNAGFGYKNPKIVIQEPTLLNEYGAMDMVRETSQQFQYENVKYRDPLNNVENFDGEDFDINLKRIKKNTNSTIRQEFESNMQKRQKEFPYSSNSEIKIEGADKKERTYVVDVLDFQNKELKTASSESRRKLNMRSAVIEVSKLNKDGAIVELSIKDRGRGYDPDPNNPPRVFVVDTEDEGYMMRGPNTKEAAEKFREAVSKISESETIELSDGRKVETNRQSLKRNLRKRSKVSRSELNVLDDGTIGAFETMMEGFNATYPTGYIKIGEVDDIETTDLCQGIPKSCVKIKMPSLVGKSLFKISEVKNIIKNSQEFKDVMNTDYDKIQKEAQVADSITDTLSDLYGWNAGKECITIPQPKFYNVTRFRDLPCPYIDDNTGRAFGFIVYKYCGSKSDNGHFKVNLSVRGKTTGEQGEKFMNFLHNLPQPDLTQPREVKLNNDGKDCWECKKNIAGGAVEGRCYWDPSGGDDVVFVPIGLDENTYDWQHQYDVEDRDGNTETRGFTELEQLQVWLGDNIEGYRARQTTYTVPPNPGTPGTPGSGVEGDPDYVPPTPGEPGHPGRTGQNNYYYVASLERTSGGMPRYECWDTYVKRSSGDGNRDGVLDVYCAYYPEGSGENQTQGRVNGATFFESQIYDGYPTTGFNWACIYQLLFQNYDILGYDFFGNIDPDHEFALEYVNDLSIAIDPQLMNQLGIVMGPFSGTLNIKNWSAGATVAFGQTAKNMGNPFFDECSGGIFDKRNEVVQPNPPTNIRKVHNSSYDPGDKGLLKKQYMAGKIGEGDITFEDDTWKEFYDPDFDYEDLGSKKISDFSTDVDNLFNA